MQHESGVRPTTINSTVSVLRFLFTVTRKRRDLSRALVITRLTAFHDAGRLAFFGSMTELADRKTFLRHLAPVRKKRWVVYAKPPFAGPEAVLD